ncbi:MAG: hypothetical protein RIR31_24 [Bacteroidota bacterium]
MKKKLLLLFIAAVNCQYALAQQPQFNVLVDDKIHHYGPSYGIVQDQQGYTWFTSFSKGLIKYDGKTFKTFRHEPENSNSPASNFMVSMVVDPAGNIWIAHFGSGLDKFNPVTNTFTHYKNNKADPNSIISDSVFTLLIDRMGKLWMGTTKGLESLDIKTGKFTHYQKKINDKAVSISPGVFALYEDKAGIIWYATGDFLANKAGEFDGLFRLDPSAGKQTFYKADPKNAESLIDPFVFSIFEDSRGNFWLGTKGNGLHTLDRKTGKFTRHLYNPLQPGKLSRPPISTTDTTDAISFIREDRHGKLWIGSFENGVNWYDPATKQLQHFGLVKDQKNNAAFAKDTLAGFKESGAIRCIIAADSSTWITGSSGNIFIISDGRKTIPFFSNNKSVNAFYLEPNGNILWFGTDSGLVRKDLIANTKKVWVHDAKNTNSLNNNSAVAITADENGKLYIGTHTGGLDLFDPVTEKFTPVKPANAADIRMDSIHSVFIENERYLWLGGENGLAKVDRSTNRFTVYRFNKENEKGIVGNTVYSITKDKKGNLWFANFGGLDRFISDSNTFRQYLKGYSVRAVLTDAKGIVWAGTDIGLFKYNEAKDQFVQFNPPVFSTGIETILNILEDNQQNLWITTVNSIIKISANREYVQLFNADYGIFSLDWNWLNNFKAADGRILIGGQKGYYLFKPEEINVSNLAPVLNFAQLIIGGKEVFPRGDENILSAPIWKTEKINLAYNQNTFAVDFVAVNYNSSDAIKYQYKLETVDKEWNNLGTDHKASFFNLPPGNYTLHIRAVNSEGTVTEKKLSIIISPPWWKTWWAYCLYALLIGGSILAYIQYRSKSLKRENQVLEQKVEHRTKQLQESIESLKATQAQLVQSEKMASLGELTAGIAHEIQNPLNFVNNFSEVSTDLTKELVDEVEKGNTAEVKLIAHDLVSNLEKINHHGKRAGEIVRGMLQHSRTSSGQKQLTDINALCDEYLRLAYHGLRAKDKTFNATLKTDYDDSIGNINIIAQDIGRVILNLITNAFYVVDEKKKQQHDGYEPTVSVSTKKVADKILISVKDNGNGIPQKILDKIFQPFFTTKPTGQGTGLGLSLSYDIVKAHGGELKVETKEGEGSTFIIQLPFI